MNGANDTDTLLIRISEQVRALADDMGEVKHLLVGAGDDGLVQQVAGLQERVNSVEKSSAAKWASYGTIAAALLALLGILLQSCQ
jgi:hypothetical protein